MQKAEGGLPVVATLMNQSQGHRSINKQETRDTAIIQLARAMREMLGRTTFDLLLRDNDVETTWQHKLLIADAGSPVLDSAAVSG
jgi:hypothetical protein